METRKRSMPTSTIACCWRCKPFSIIICLQFLIVGGLQSTCLFAGRRSSVKGRWRTTQCPLSAHGPPQILPSTADETSKEGPSESNFWYSVSRSPEFVAEEENPPLPAVSTLDKSGPLPRGAYYNKPSAIDYGTKQICRISTAIDLTRRRIDEELDQVEIVKNMQKFVDSGLNSFQLKSSIYNNMYSWAIDTVYARFYAETPRFLTDRCHLTVPYVVPSEYATGITRTLVRAEILETLGRIGADIIDEIQVQFRDGSPYRLDVLDYLKELQQEGFVGSVSTQNFSPTLLRVAKSAGFSVSSSQIDMNLLDPSAYSMEQRLASDDLTVPLAVAYPLASGLLTNRFLGMREMPYPWRLSVSERRSINTILEKWGRMRHVGPDSLWDKYQEVMLRTLEDISFKHGVTVASVVLRWTLQLEHVDETVVTCRLQADEWGVHPSKPRQERLREVFTFSLDEEDMTRLWEVSGKKGPDSMRTEYDDKFLIEAMEYGDMEPLHQSGGNDKIDFSNRRLWL